MAKKATPKKAAEKKPAPPKKKIITYRHWNGESYEERKREEKT